MQADEFAGDRTTETLAIALGWFSVALGLAELVAPRQVARLIGVPSRETTTNVLRAYGARELASGIAILSQPTQARWLWSRVGGDAIDLATLGQAAREEAADRRRLSLATAAVLGVTALDVIAAARSSSSSDGYHEGGLHLPGEQAVTVKASLDAAETAWVEWCASGHARLEDNYAVRFEPAPGARGTEIYLSGGGSKGTMREELRRFKQRLETGEIPLSDGPGLWRPAQPGRDAQQRDRIAEVPR